jgi:hypothetical protein
MDPDLFVWMGRSGLSDSKKWDIIEATVEWDVGSGDAPMSVRQKGSSERQVTHMDGSDEGGKRTRTDRDRNRRGADRRQLRQSILR